VARRELSIATKLNLPPPSMRAKGPSSGPVQGPAQLLASANRRISMVADPKGARGNQPRMDSFSNQGGPGDHHGVRGTGGPAGGESWATRFHHLQATVKTSANGRAGVTAGPGMVQRSMASLGIPAGDAEMRAHMRQAGRQADDSPGPSPPSALQPSLSMGRILDEESGVEKSTTHTDPALVKLPDCPPGPVQKQRSKTRSAASQLISATSQQAMVAQLTEDVEWSEDSYFTEQGETQGRRGAGKRLAAATTGESGACFQSTLTQT
jgi:hypothetical protein